MLRYVCKPECIDFKLKLFLDPRYEKAFKNCGSSHYKSYRTLKDAITACSVDLRCTAVLDDGCDNRNDFYLCSKVDALSLRSCVYNKKDGRFHEGKM